MLYFFHKDEHKNKTSELNRNNYSYKLQSFDSIETKLWHIFLFYFTWIKCVPYNEYYFYVFFFIILMDVNLK